MWRVLANYVTSVRTFWTVSCQPLPSVYWAHWSRPSYSGDDTDPQPPDHQSLHLCSREGVCTHLHLCILFCTELFLHFHAKLIAHCMHVCTWVCAIVVHMHTYTTHTYARTHAPHTTGYTLKLTWSKVIYVLIDFYGVFKLVVLLNVMKVISPHHPFRFIFTTPVRILPWILTMPVKEQFLSM